MIKHLLQYLHQAQIRKQEFLNMYMRLLVEQKRRLHQQAISLVDLILEQLTRLELQHIMVLVLQEYHQILYL